MKQKLIIASLLSLCLLASAQNKENKPVQSNLAGSSLSKFKYNSQEKKSSSTNKGSNSNKPSKSVTPAKPNKPVTSNQSQPKVTAPQPSASSSLYAQRNNSPYYNYDLETISPVLIDLGLESGTQWANMNVGASNPYIPGEFYVYIEEPSFSDPNIAIPSKMQWQELIDSCDWEWVSIDGGRQEAFRVIGPNGNSIILPYTGVYQFEHDSFHNGDYGEFWSSSDINSGGLDEGYYLSLKKRADGGNPGQVGKTAKTNGLTIRLVYNPGTIREENFVTQEGYKAHRTTEYQNGITTITETYTDNEGSKIKITTTKDKNGKVQKRKSKTKTVDL